MRKKFENDRNSSDDPGSGQRPDLFELFHDHWHGHGDGHKSDLPEAGVFIISLFTVIKIF